MRRLTAPLSLLLVFLLSCQEPESRSDLSGMTPSPEDQARSAEGLPPQGYEAPAGEPLSTAQGQVLYVPVYSQIFHREDGRTLNLTATLSIRNTSRQDTIALRAVDYYDTEGELVRRHLEEPRRIAPLASTHFLVSERDRAGGVGANFIVEWRAERPVTAPVVEAVMISTHSSLGISLTSPARALSQE